MSEGVVHGLIAMGTDDAKDLAAGATPATLADFPAGLALLIGQSEADGLLARYAAVYGKAPDALMPALTAELDLTKPDTPVNRFVLWAMLIDGFVPPSASTASVASPLVQLAAAPPALPTPGMQVTFIPSPYPGLDIRDFATLLGQLAGMAYAIPFEVVTTPGLVHEGHGGPGPSMDLIARHLPYYAPPPTTFSFGGSILPSTRNPSGLPITIDVEPDVLSSHGSVSGPLGTPISTDVTGAAKLTFQAKKEDADGQGDLQSDVGVVKARVSLRDLLDAHYLLPPGAQNVVSGERVAFATAQVEWHEFGQWIIDGASGGGRITGLKCNGPGGEWKATGTYEMNVGGAKAKGSQEWIITIDKDTLKGPYEYHDTQKMKVAGVTVTTIGDVLGNATVSIDQTTGQATINLRETVHTFSSTTSAGGEGSDSNAPLQSSSMTWDPTDTCP